MKSSYYNEFFEKGQLEIHFDLYQIGLPSDDPVFTLKKVLEDLNYSSLMAQYSDKGRKGYHPIMMFAVLIYANMCGVRAIDRIVELCQRDYLIHLAYPGAKAQVGSFYDFVKNKRSDSILKDLHYQFLRRQQKGGLFTLETLFIDGTKIEANANRYTFVWRGSINYHLTGLLDNIDDLYTRCNDLLSTNGYDKKYILETAQKFGVEGLDRVREVQSKMQLKRKGVSRKPLLFLIPKNEENIEILHNNILAFQFYNRRPDYL